MKREALFSFALLLCSEGVRGDGNDWINPQFVLQKTGAPMAQQKITTYAKNMAKQGPWTVFGQAKVLPPNGDKLDYLSWAPYHWPDCNWCSGPRSHLAKGGNRTDSSGNDTPSGNGTWDGYDPYDSEGDGVEAEDTTYGDAGGEVDDDEIANGEDEADGVGSADDDKEDGGTTTADVASIMPVGHRRMMKRLRRNHHLRDEAQAAFSQESEGEVPLPPSVTIPDGLPTSILGNGASTTARNVASGTSGVAANARKTTKAVPKAKSTQKASQNGNCTPSPTKSLPPSATWTTCKYVTKDGKANPDVRDLPGVSMIATASQGIIYNALASVFTGSEVYAQNAARFISTFFLDSKTGMHPRIQYGQVIRGPGKQEGQYLGVLDFRGMVKVANAIQIMRASGSSSWTATLDAQMSTWAGHYLEWLHSSSQGQKALSAPNNHGSFAANQLAAIAIVEGNNKDASVALRSYFNGQFREQIAASGEQPFEAVRTRPFHYRCFNLEAMITNAKLGDQIGLDFWNAKSKYGANIQDALNFVMSKGPGKEDVTDILPLVAAVAAAYGDPQGKYDAFLRKNDKRYQSAPYYFYDQRGALTKGPSSGKRKDVDKEAEQNKSSETTNLDVATPTGIPVATPTIPFDCPPAFATATQVELDDGVYVTCDELKPFYGYTDDVVDSS